MLLAILAVEFFMNVAEVRVGDMCVDLRRVDGGVAEELLDRANVGTVTQEVGGKGVPKRVRRDNACDAGEGDVCF